MKILNIAEKPSVARSISSVLSNSFTVKRGFYKYCPNIYFDLNDEMIFTSVLGHLYEIDFENKQKWTDVDPLILFNSRILKSVNKNYTKIKENIEREARRADKAIIWTDCDREGENIGKEIREVIRGVSNIDVKRAKFSGITREEILNALNNLVEINEYEADAVDARMELDLRIGSALTRLQTLSLAPSMDFQKKILSFGPCQIPTLGFVVERARTIENFIEEPFWSINAQVKKKEDGKITTTTFSWDRGGIFDKNCVVHFYNKLKNKNGVIIKKDVNEKTKYRPLPLRTVELQKTCSTYYKISSHQVMEIAEKLYNKGYISYPRTETDVFDTKFDYRGTLNRLSSDGNIGTFASDLLTKFKYPRAGKNNDLAHSPIYPLKNGNDLSNLDRNIYDFISRRFLAALSENAKGIEISFHMEIDGEFFSQKGLKITEKNYLNVYFYDKWEEKEIANFNLNETVHPELCINESKTSPPDYLSEADLISLMDKNGIGTDATIHEHIHKIQERNYAQKVGTKIKPLKLGVALITGYESLNLEISKPFLRKELELNLKKICSGETNSPAVISSEIEMYISIYKKIKEGIEGFVLLLKNGIELDETEKKKPPYKKSKTIENNQFDNKSNKPVTQPKYKSENIENINKNNRKEENTSVIMCNCNKQAKELETKNGPNTGRKFYSCSEYPTKCRFFQWVDTNIEKKNNDDVLPKCFCGFETQVLTANTEANKGRKFYKCKKKYKACKFFEWENN